MPKKILCCRIRAWVMIISWLKVIFHVVYIILIGMNLLHLAGVWGGPDNLKQAVAANPQKYPEYYRVLEYAYEYLLFYLLCLLGLNIIALPLNVVVLLRGAIDKNERQIKTWLYFTLINVVASSPYVLWRLVNTEYVTNSAIKITINYIIEFLCLWCVFTFFNEIKSTSNNQQSQHFTFSPNMLMNEGGEDNREPSPPTMKKKEENTPFASYNLR